MNYDVYKMKKVEDSSTLQRKVDSFISFYSQEDRSMNALAKLHLKNTDLDNVMLLHFEDEDVASLKNISQIYGLNISQVRIKKDLSTNLIDCLKQIDAYIKDKNSIGIDISCMPIPYFAQILRFLYKRYEKKTITVYYTEPSHYNLNKLFDFSAYEGEIDIKVIPGYEGKSSQINETQRIVFYLMGFEVSYMNKLIPQEINPDSIAPINGFPSYFPKYKDISLVNNNGNFFEKDIDLTYTEANNPFETFNQMLLLSAKNSTYCIDIIPVGTKPMALGACLFALKNGNTDCRMIFPFPTEYNTQQSSGNGTVWEYAI